MRNNCMQRLFGVQSKTFLSHCYSCMYFSLYWSWYGRGQMSIKVADRVFVSIHSQTAFEIIIMIAAIVNFLLLLFVLAAAVLPAVSIPLHILSCTMNKYPCKYISKIVFPILCHITCTKHWSTDTFITKVSNFFQLINTAFICWTILCRMSWSYMAMYL